jgi:hypothetical protein
MITLSIGVKPTAESLAYVAKNHILTAVRRLEFDVSPQRYHSAGSSLISSTAPPSGARPLPYVGKIASP